MRASLILAGLLFLTAACTFEDGRGWATVRVLSGAELLVDEAHASEEATLVTDRGDLVTVTSLRLTLAGVALLENSGSASGTSGSFDPANPPPDYTLCHGGHCHRSDGALVDYEDIAAEMAGGGASALVVVEDFAVTGALDALSPALVELGTFESGTASLAAVELHVAALELSGEVLSDTERRPLQLSLRPEGGLRLRGELVAELGRGGAASPDLELWLVLPGDLLDGLAFENLALVEGALRIDQANNPSALELVAARMAGLSPEAHLIP